jgi:hypothetical protein
MKKEFHIHLVDGTSHIKDLNPIFDLLRKQGTHIPLLIDPLDPLIAQLVNMTFQGFCISEKTDKVQRFIAPSQIKHIDVVFESI